mgnify:CR=1 FL=1
MWRACASKADVDRLKNDTESLSTFGFLYGTFPTAPSLFFYIAQYKFIDSELISAALVIGTLASAPLMMVSGKMIALQFDNNTQINNFEDIECKLAYGFSFVTWFCCLWVIYIFLVSGRLFRHSHRYTFYLIVAQMANSLVHILWSYLSNDVSSLLGYLHVIFALFTSFLTRCLPLAIMLNILSLFVTRRYNQRRHASNRVNFHRVRGDASDEAATRGADNSNLLASTSSSSHSNGSAGGMGTKYGSIEKTPKLNRFILNTFANSAFFRHFLGLLVPVLATAFCLIAGNSIPAKQTMMISLGKPQIVISILLLTFVVLTITYLIILFINLRNNLRLNDRARKKERLNRLRLQQPMTTTRTTKLNNLTKRYKTRANELEAEEEEESESLLINSSTRRHHHHHRRNFHDDDHDDDAAANSSDSQSKVNSTLLLDTNKNNGNSSNNNNNNTEQPYSYSIELEANNDDNQQLLTSKEHSSSYETTKLKAEMADHQIMQHLALVVVLTFNSLMCLFFQLWALFDESRSAIYYELQLIDATLLYGQVSLRIE